MGDPAGIGPEIIAGAWSDRRMHASSRLVALGHPAILRRAVESLGLDVHVREVDHPAEVASSTTLLPCVNCVRPEAVEVPPAKVDARGGQAAYDAVLRAVELALAGEIDGLTTAPLNKAALHLAGHRVPGHTELLARCCEVDEYAMMLYAAPGERIRGAAGLGIVHVTLHTALRNVFALLTSDAILSKARLADRVMRAFRGDETIAPRIGVAALNPHAGEQGLSGYEEQNGIAPAVARGCYLGMQLFGPLPCDTLMVRAAAGEFDAVVAMYHDQGHIALKLLDLLRAVNITLGLPIVRTSVAHGTAFDRAWQGRADPRGLVEAVRVAAQLVERRTRDRRLLDVTP